MKKFLFSFNYRFILTSILLSLMAAIFLIAGCSTLNIYNEETNKQMNKSFSREVTKTVSANYLLYLPKEYGKEKKEWPLVLFLHGIGERGNDLQLVKRHGPPKLVEAGKEFPFILVSPQCPDDSWWSNDVLDGLLQEVEEKYDVDKNRVYVTGLSMGGYGTWSLAMEYPHRFAAIAPVCGGGNERLVCKLKDMPIWVFHGAKDNVVPIAESQKLVDALKKCGNDVKFTIYPEANHDAWTETYNNPKLYKWLLSHSLKK